MIRTFQFLESNVRLVTEHGTYEATMDSGIPDQGFKMRGKPEVYFQGNWVPICGLWFKKNAFGASLFCQQLGLDSGKVHFTERELEQDALIIGRCNEEDDNLMSCTETCNGYVLGTYDECPQGDCTKGAPVGIDIECFRGIKIVILMD